MDSIVKLIIKFIFSMGLLILVTVISIAFEKDNKDNGIEYFKTQFTKNFHLNNAFIFWGYEVFDFKDIFAIFSILSLTVYILEIYFMKNISSDVMKSHRVMKAKTGMLVIGAVAQLVSCSIILNQ